MNTANNIYLPEEIIDQEYLHSVRIKLIKNMVKDENNLPEDAKTLEALNSLISSGEKSIHDRVANRLKHQDNQNKDALNELVASTLLQLNLNQTAKREGPVNTDIDEKYIPVDIVPGELSTDKEELDIEDFT